MEQNNKPYDNNEEKCIICLKTIETKCNANIRLLYLAHAKCVLDYQEKKENKKDDILSTVENRFI